MLTIITKCPNCLELQLSDFKCNNKNVVCAHCGQAFKCKVESGPYRWTQPLVSRIAEGSFKKVVSKVVLTYGVGVPIANQDAFIEHVGCPMNFGDTVAIKIKLEETVYDVKASLFKNKRGESSLHIVWGTNKKIKQHIQRLFPQAYSHFCVDGNKGFLQGCEFMISPGNEEGVFVFTVFDEKNANDTVKEPEVVAPLAVVESKRRKKSRLSISELLEG